MPNKNTKTGVGVVVGLERDREIMGMMTVLIGSLDFMRFDSTSVIINNKSHPKLPIYATLLNGPSL